MQVWREVFQSPLHLLDGVDAGARGKACRVSAPSVAMGNQKMHVSMILSRVL